MECFTEAIALEPGNHVFYSNRSAALASLAKFDEALADAAKVVELKPDWPKGYSRKGAAEVGLKRFDEAIASYQQGLALDPANATLQEGLRDAEAAKAAGAPNPVAQMFSDPGLLGKLAMNPQTSAFLQQPDFLQMIQAIQRNPSSVNMYLQDPRMMQVLGVLLGLNVDPSGGAGGPGGPPQPAPEPEPKPEPEPEKSPEELAAAEAKEKALAEKQLGNAAYKKKDFETALRHYDAAIALDDTDVSFVTNKAAVYFEMGDYERCMETCDTAVEKGRSLRADYKVIAKAMTRKGNALVKLGRVEEGIKQYQKSLTEHRSADTLKRLNDAEKALKTKKEQDYIDMAKCAEAKEKGNAFFKEQNFPEAVKMYTDAIKRGPPAVNPECYKIYSNRAACYTKLMSMNEALKDANQCIELAPDFAKGYSRKGTVQFFMKEYNKAMETYQLGLQKDPENQELKDGLSRCIQKINMGNAGMLSEQEQKERQAHAMADPEIQQILSDPIMRQVLQDFSENPKAAQAHQRNPEIMAKIQKLVNAGVVQVR